MLYIGDVQGSYLYFLEESVKSIRKRVTWAEAIREQFDGKQSRKKKKRQEMMQSEESESLAPPEHLRGHGGQVLRAVLESSHQLLHQNSEKQRCFFVRSGWLMPEIFSVSSPPASCNA